MSHEHSAELPTGTPVYFGPSPPNAELIIDAIETLQGVRYAEKAELMQRLGELTGEVKQLRAANEELARKLAEREGG